MPSSHRAVVGLQAEEHDLIDATAFRSAEDYVLHRMHEAAYRQAAIWAGGKRVLDVGCNTGYGTAILANHASEAVGVDVSRKAIAEAIQQHGAANTQFHNVDGIELPFVESSFDLVTSFQVIEHVVDYDLYVTTIKRVLKPTGAVVFTTPNGVLRLDPGMKPWNRFHVREFSAHEVFALLTRYFKHVTVYGLFADDVLYSVERKRVERARAAARPLARTLRSIAKAVAPTKLMHAYRYVRQRRRAGAERESDYPAMYAGSSLYYRRNKLENALDLMVVCSDDLAVHRAMTPAGVESRSATA
jgi:ubiquinone/menaquinone biosynthesis C-methylase UbiE